MVVPLNVWFIREHPINIYDLGVPTFQDGSKTVQEPKPLHIRNRTGPESEKIESFGIESDWIDQDFKEPEHGNN